MSSVATAPQTNSTFRPAFPSDLPRITELLIRAFKSPPDAPYISPRLMQWKYWQPREDWAGPRSYVLERNGILFAHIGIWPATLLNTKGERITGVHIIDWAAARNSPGAGTDLMKKLAEMFDFVYCIGGSHSAQKVLPALGFTQYTTTWRGARPLRPVRQILSHPDRNWKLPARLVRNFLWSIYPAVAAQNGWKSAPTTPQDSADLLKSISSGTPSFPRSQAFFDYLRNCPNATVQLHTVHDPHGPRGFFALARVFHQVRLAGLWLRDPDFESLRQAYILAQHSAAEITGVYEFVALNTQGQSCDAASSAGLHLSAGPIVYVLDKKQNLSANIQFQLCDNDAFFSHNGRASYWS
jgi:hypothetical protein